MSDSDIHADISDGESSSTSNTLDVKPRLLRSRRYRHGLSVPPAGKHPEPRGERALLPCPLPEQGACRYRRAYGCTDTIQSLSRDGLGFCGVEFALYELLVDHAVKLIGRKRLEDVPEGLRPALLAWVEAQVYQRRALAHLAMRQVDAVPGPSHENSMRYLTAGTNASLRRQKAFFEAALSLTDTGGPA